MLYKLFSLLVRLNTLFVEKPIISSHIAKHNFGDFFVGKSYDKKYFIKKDYSRMFILKKEL